MDCVCVFARTFHSMKFILLWHQMPACRTYSQFSAFKIGVGSVFLLHFSFHFEEKRLRRFSFDFFFSSSVCFIFLLVFGWMVGCLVVRI